MHPVKILSDPLGGKEFAEARERRNKSRGPENGETNPLTTFDYVIRTHGRDRSCVRSIHRIALLPPPPPSSLSPSPSAFRLEADRWPLSTQACTNYSCLVGADEWR